MTPVVFDAHDARALDAAQQALAAGALIVYPTDTLYALGGRASDAQVAAAIRRAKGRADDRPLPVIAADRNQVRALTTALSPQATSLADRFWPGPLTLVLPAAAGLPQALVSGAGGVAVRIPALALARRLCQGVGALIATSANRSGEPPATTCAEALRAVGRHVTLAIDGGSATTLIASTVVDLTGAVPRLVRPGAVAWHEVLDALAMRDPR